MGIIMAVLAVVASRFQEMAFYSSIIAKIFMSEDVDSQNKRRNNGSNSGSNNKSRDESYKSIDNKDQQTPKDSDLLSKSVMDGSKSFVFKSNDTRSYLGLIKLLQTRIPFKYLVR